MSTLRRKLWLEEGQDIAEHAVMVAVILTIVVGTVCLIGNNSNTVFSNFPGTIQWKSRSSLPPPVAIMHCGWQARIYYRDCLVQPLASPMNALAALRDRFRPYDLSGICLILGWDFPGAPWLAISYSHWSTAVPSSLPPAPVLLFCSFLRSPCPGSCSTSTSRYHLQHFS
jgi:hypothetical protein